MMIRFPLSLASAAMLFALLSGVAQAQSPAQPPKPFQGVITAISGSTLTVKADAGAVYAVQVPADAVLLRIAPGAKDLSAAEKIAFTGLAVGDRALVRPDPDAAGPAITALRVVAIKQSDLAQKQQKERAEWQGGLVKSVDASSGTILLSTGAGAMAKTIAVHTGKATVLKRYAPASVSIDAATVAPIDAIQPGDQLQVRGQKNADNTEIAAVEVYSGAFRNISGPITAIDAAGATFVVKDLATKKSVTIHVTAEAQMRRLPDRMAQMLAMRLKGGAAMMGGAATGGQGPWGGGAPPSSAPGGQRGGSGVGGPGAGGGQWPAAGGGPPDLQQMLNRAPVIQLTDLVKGEVVMLVATGNATEVSAIKLLAGVEPLLESPAASRDLLANWSMNSGSGAAEAAAQ
jgi:hypothetical protein